jgi:hypothetical protein
MAWMFRIAAFTIASLGLLAIADAAPVAGDPHALFARERAVTGGDAWNHVAAVRTTGVVIMGGAPSRFAQIVDMRTGWSKTTTRIGAVTDESGYDGVAWDFQGAAIGEQTLPALRADSVTQAYVIGNGWWRPGDAAKMSPLGVAGNETGVRVLPAGGSAVDVWFDLRTGLIDRTVAHTDSGDVVTALDDYRATGAIVVPYRSAARDATGALTIANSREVAAIAVLPRDAFSRPQPRSAGHLRRGAPAMVPFLLSDHPGAIVANVRINGRPARVIFDSGGANYLTPAAAKRLALHTAGGISVSGVGTSSVAAGYAEFGPIALGDAVLDDQHGIVGPLPFAALHERAGLDVDGLIGTEVLQAFRTVFDFDARRMTLTSYASAASRPAGAVVEPIFSDGSSSYVRASLDGVPGIFLLDTGDNGDITVFRRFAAAHGLLRGPGVRYEGIGGVGGGLGYRRYRAHTFTLGGATMLRPPVAVTDAPAGAFASRGVAGNIGLRVIARFHVIFDYRAHTIAFTPGAGLGAPFLIDRTGMGLNQTDLQAFHILSIVPGSPAALAGLHAGERIVAVNGRSVASARLGLYDIQPYITGTHPYRLDVLANDGSPRSVVINPRAILPDVP